MNKHGHYATDNNPFQINIEETTLDQMSLGGTPMLEDPHKWRWPGTAGEFTKCAAKDPLPLYLDEELETRV